MQQQMPQQPQQQPQPRQPQQPQLQPRPQPQQQHPQPQEGQTLKQTPLKLQVLQQQMQQQVQRHMQQQQQIQLQQQLQQQAQQQKSNAAADKNLIDKNNRASNRRGQVQTLSTSLQLLSHENPDCLFIVRRINKLGFKASRTLKRHFSMYGTVVRVLVAHSTVRQHGDPQCHVRRRPSSLGFVQMAASDAVQKVLAKGAEQDVLGALIRVQKFERQNVGEGHEEFDEEDDGEVEQEQAQQTAPSSSSGQDEVSQSPGAADAQWQRKRSNSSDATTAATSEALLQASDSDGDAEEQ
eukprot:gnl/TRDRNA2_/TRDRNA2_169602_c2_seq1.p1 gnl/TRDRNA2_/TRDRNA2_169602_c2~~gnl/TRDRNA2_/TRDRNA2_169602_c2_seq1.p1  ORF type:complete len:295 (+),score=91.98 gnl/TRDRNA2_/TRDRNA2_169602_c2_seq1:2-886(+)